MEENWKLSTLTVNLGVFQNKPSSGLSWKPRLGTKWYIPLQKPPDVLQIN
jgi:hypothetical protein